MKRLSLCMVAALCLVCAHSQLRGQILGTAEAYAVLGGSTVTNTGPSVLTGDLGVSPGSAITGFPPGIVIGTQHPGDAAAQQAHTDAAAGFVTLATMAPTTVLTGTDLGGLTLTPGVYFFETSAFLTGTLTLNGQGDPNALFVFRIGSTLISADGSSVLTLGGADGCNIYWQVGSSATLGLGSAFQGSIIAQASITMTTGASIVDGRAIALDGAVTLDSNSIAVCIPSPGAALLMGAAAFGGFARRSRAV